MICFPFPVMIWTCCEDHTLPVGIATSDPCLAALVVLSLFRAGCFALAMPKELAVSVQ